MKEQQYTPEQFTVTTEQLAEAHAVTQMTVRKYAKAGAFPFARKEGSSLKGFRYYHEDALNLTMGDIKRNIESGEYEDPIFTIPRSEKNPSEKLLTMNDMAEQVQQNAIKLDLICENLGIELDEDE